MPPQQRHRSRSQDPTDARATEYEGASPALTPWPLVDRDEQRQALAEARAQRRNAVVVGPPGAGKTRLAREALTDATHERWDPVWVVATKSAAAIPFGALSFLPQLTADDKGGLGAIREIVAALAQRAARQPIVFAVDNAHLLDDASAALVQLLAYAVDDVVVMATMRHEPAPDAVEAVAWDESTVRVGVEALTAAAVDRLVSASLDGPVDGLSLRQIRQLSSGNPLVLRELLRQGRLDGAFTRTDGVWRLRQPLYTSTLLRDIVWQRMAALPPSTRAVLELVSCGEELPLGLLEHLATPTAIANAECSGLLVVEEGPDGYTARLDEPLHSWVLRKNMPVVRTRAVWRELARGLAEVSPAGAATDRAGLVRRALWQVRGGAIDDPTILSPAAAAAFDQQNLATAEQLARRANQHTPGGVDEPLLFEVLTAAGRYEEAEAAFADAAPAQPTARGRWAAVRTAVRFWCGPGDWRESEAPGQVGGGAGCGSTAAAAGPEAVARCWVLLFADRLHEARWAGQRVLDQLPHASDEVLAAQAAAATSCAAALLGRFGAAARIGSRLLPAAARQAGRVHPAEAGRGGGLRWLAEPTGYLTAVTLVATGRITQAVAMADYGYQAAVAAGSAPAAAGWLAVRGSVDLLRGRGCTAASALQEAVALLRDGDPLRLLGFCLSRLAAATALGGDTETAHQWLAASGHELRPSDALFTAWSQLDRAWVLAADGRTTEAIELVTATADRAQRRRHATLELVARYDMVRLGTVHAAYPRLVQLADAVDGTLAGTFADAAAGLLTEDWAALEVAAEAFADHDLMLLAAEASTAAARGLRATGRRTRATAAAGRASAHVAACEGARTPMVDADQRTELLTRREREVALLAAEHQTSQAIAERLRVSIRTVDNHLARAYAKLGVAGRRELTAVLSPEVGHPNESPE